jgi:hypothetical protein
MGLCRDLASGNLRDGVGSQELGHEDREADGQADQQGGEKALRQDPGDVHGRRSALAQVTQ